MTLGYDRRQGDGQGLPPPGGPFQVSATQREGPGKGFELAALNSMGGGHSQLRLNSFQSQQGRKAPGGSSGLSVSGEVALTFL